MSDELKYDDVTAASVRIVNDSYRDRLVVLAEKWEGAARAETGADTFRNGFLSGQNWAAQALRGLLWDVEEQLAGSADGEQS